MLVAAHSHTGSRIGFGLHAPGGIGIIAVIVIVAVVAIILSRRNS
jgi:hypothetical protein